MLRAAENAACSLSRPDIVHTVYTCMYVCSKGSDRRGVVHSVSSRAVFCLARRGWLLQ
jgi:hypothetical protein